MENFKIGDICYYIEDLDTSIQEAKIMNMDSENCNIKNKKQPWNCIISVKELYKSREEAELAKKSRIQKIKSEYRNSITDIKSLVEFCFGNNTAPCEEYTDWQAREVAIEKAKELLDLDLEN